MQWQPSGVNGDIGPPALSHVEAGSREGRGVSVRAGMVRRSSHMARSMRRRLAATMPVEVNTQHSPQFLNKTFSVAAEWTWSEWGSCDITCFHADGHRGVRTRENSCKEGSPRHETFNCEYPPGGLEQTDRPCPGLPQCK